MWIQTEKNEMINLDRMDRVTIEEAGNGFSVDIDGAAAVCAVHESDFYKLFDCVSRADAESKMAAIAKNLPRVKL